MKKSKINFKRVGIAFAIMVIIVVGVYFVITTFTGDKKTGKTTEVINEIKEYGYTLDDNETKLYNGLFKDLEAVLKSSKVDEEEYASLISQLFIADFYTLDNKLTNGDIGGVQFVHKDAKANFILKAQDTIYKYVENNMDGKRNQELPEIDAVTVEGVYAKSYEYNDKTDEKGYEVKLSWTYKEDLGYPNSGTIIIVHETDKKLSIVELN